MAPKERPAHLPPSQLGTKEYWDSLYATEVANHASNPQDTGTVWFDDADAETKMVQFLAALDDEGALPAAARVLDLGCGNGSLLRAVRGELFADRTAGRLLNVDYSEASIALARTITEGEEDETTAMGTAAVPIEYAVWDVLHGRPEELAQEEGEGPATWDLVLDKGTFDAISLGADDSRRAVETQYRAQVLRLLRTGGRLLITSCNWTEAELCAWMEEGGDGEDGEEATLVKTGSVQYPSFQFGGVQGQAVVTLCFEKQTRQ